ncbi:hypothetical protein ACSMXM_00275 [Pacificimonas sp. ICDLI1SI03]
MSEATPLFEAILIRMFRVWHAARDAEQPLLPSILARAGELGLEPVAGVACASLFDLVEASLGRQLVPECCCSRMLSPDELALVGLVRCALRAGNVHTTTEAPHGLSGAVRWAALAVRRELGAAAKIDDAPASGPPRQCPFSDARGYDGNAHAA